jgi:16S rRNA (adenine1518-N6/adenine1519-N6)-dimethyltransferase
VSYPSPRALLEKYRLGAKKSWGQHFLGDEAILTEIALLAAPAPGARVVELGAGLGHLTARLAALGARVVAVERDRDMARVLRGELGDRVVVVEADAVKVDYRKLAGSFPSPSTVSRDPGPEADRSTGRGSRVARAGAGEGADRVAVAGNLPYHLTSPILFSLLDQADSISRFAFLLQREVAERLAAPAGDRAAGLLSVLLQHRAEVRIARRVPRGAFLPPPEVESAVLAGEVGPPRAPVADPARFRRLVKAGFAQRRKTLANALRAARLAPEDRLRAALGAAGIDPARRGETLSVEEWAALDRALGRD